MFKKTLTYNIIDISLDGFNYMYSRNAQPVQCPVSSRVVNRVLRRPGRGVGYVGRRVWPLTAKLKLVCTARLGPRALASGFGLGMTLSL